MTEKRDRKSKKTKVYTIPVEGTRIQVTHEVYQAYYGYERHLRTLEEKDTRNGTVWYSDLDTEETLGEEMIYDPNAPAVETVAVTHVMQKALRKALTQLPRRLQTDPDALLRRKNHSSGCTIAVSADYDNPLSQRTSHKKIKKTLGKLKKVSYNPLLNSA